MRPLHEAPDFLRNPTHPITVTLIGAGGTGSLMLSRLARMDFALKQFGTPGLKIDVYDADTVESNNIGRQLFSYNDLGENKAFSLVGKINRQFLTDHISHDINFDANYLSKQFLNKNYNSSNIYITATDDAQFRIDFNAFFKSVTKYNTKEDKRQIHEQTYYWMDFGNAKNTGQCVLASKEIIQNNPNNKAILPSVIDRFPNILEQQTEDIQGLGCSYQAKLEQQSLFINDALSVLGSHILQDLISKGYTDKVGFFANLDSLKTNPIFV